MMKLPTLKRGPIAAIEAELANLAARRETLDARRADAAARLEAAKSARKNALAGDPNADLTRLTATVRDAEDEIETLDGVLFDLREQTTDAERRLAEAKDQDVRAKAAKDLEKIASTFDDGAAELHAAMTALGKAAAKMTAALPETLHVVDIRGDHDDKRDEAERLVSAIVAEGLANVLPAAIPLNVWGEKGIRGMPIGHSAILRRCFHLGEEQIATYASDVPDGAIDTKAAAAAVVSDRLRLRAQRIVAGEMAADLSDRTPFDAPVPEPVIPSVEVFALENFAFRIDERTAAELVNRRWVRDIRQDAADVAVAAGVALRTDTPEGAAAFQEEKDRRKASPLSGGDSFLTLAMCHDLGIIRKSEDVADADEDTDNVVPLAGEAA